MIILQEKIKDMKSPCAQRKSPLILVGAVCALVGALLAGCNNSFPESNALTGNNFGASDHAALAQVADPYFASTTPGATGYKIGPLDVLDVTIFKAPELSRSVQVGTNGMINLPLIGDVRVAGKTPAMAERDVATKYNAGYLKSAQITVFVKEYNSSRVTVDGAVKEPGVYPTRGHDTLTSVISLAKGLDQETADTEVVLFRSQAGARSAARYDLASIRAGNSPDPAIQPGDVIVVEESMMKNSFKVFTKLLPLANPIAYAFIGL